MSYTLDNEVLKNRLGITSYPELERTTADYAAARAELLKLGLGPAPAFDAAYLKALHKHLFQDVFEWAGHTRNEKITLPDGSIAHSPHLRKGGYTFTPGPDIAAALTRLFEGLAADHHLARVPRLEFADKAAAFLVALNSIHPFREGNGRTQRAFLSELAKAAGHTVNFHVVSAERNKIVSRAAANGDPDGMRRLIREITDPERVEALRTMIPLLDTGWPEMYLSTTEGGRSYVASLVETFGGHFLAKDGEKLLVGWRRDLPEPEPRSSDTVTFIASPCTSPREQS